MDYTQRELRIITSAREAQSRYLERLRSNLPDSGLLTPRELLAIMIADYAQTGIVGCDREEGGDMLLAQWGTFDFFGPPEYHFNVTRQFIVTAFEDGPMTQLSATLRYEPFEGESHEGSMWNTDHPTLEEFRLAVEAEPGFRVVADLAAPSVSIDLDEV